MYLKSVYLFAFLISFAVNEAIAFEDVICPDDEELYPCYCDPFAPTIQCNIENTTVCDLSEITLKVANMTVNPDIVFSEIAIQDVNLREISEFGFGNLKYGRVAVLYSGLKFIHPRAFHSTASATWSIDLEGNLLTDDVFHSLRSLPSVKWINLSFNNVRVIPSHAFRHTNGQFQSRLEGIFLTGNQIHTISDHTFFYLPFLSMLSLDRNQLSEFRENAFAFEDIPIGRVTHLSIDLSRNLLHANSFASKVLEHINRPVKFKLVSNNVTHLDEVIFKPFLHKHPNNTIDLSWNPLNCHCTSHWLHRNRNMYGLKVLNHLCIDKRNLWDLNSTHFDNCENRVRFKF